MERDHQNRSRRRSALVLALLCMELTAQVLCHSMLPSSRSDTGLSVANGRADSLTTEETLRSCRHCRSMNARSRYSVSLYEFSPRSSTFR